ncbi:MAG: hypothetical protein ACU84Q_05690 [Gammaproteobacteria bacterium]
MNWDAIGAIGEIIGAVAVIATIIYLARQISQSVDVARASQNRNLMESYEAYNDLILSNPIVAELLADLETGSKEIAAADTVRVRHLAYRLMNIYASAELSFRNGQLGDDEFALYQHEFESMVQLYPGILPHFLANLDRHPAMKEFEIYKGLCHAAAVT